MVTYYLRAFEDLPGFGLAEPLLYPARGANRFREVSVDAAGSVSGQLEKLSDQIYVELRESHVQASQWQLLVPVGLGSAGRQECRTVTERLDLVVGHLLDSLAEGGQMPARSIAILLDPLERDQYTYGPVDPAERIRWRIDRFGRVDAEPDEFDDLQEEHSLKWFEQLREEESDVKERDRGEWTESLERMRDRFAFVRLPFDRRPAPNFQDGLIRLTYLVGVLASSESQELLRERLELGDYYVTGSELRSDQDGFDFGQGDGKGLHQVVSRYRSRLERLRKDLSQEIEEHGEPDLQQIQAGEFSCAVSDDSLSTSELEEIKEELESVGALQWGQEDPWDSFEEQVTKIFDDQKSAIPRKLRKCGRQEWRSLQNLDRQPVDDVEDARAERDKLRRDVDERKQELFGKTGLRFRDDWRDRLQEVGGKMRSWLECRPTQGRAVEGWVAALLILLIPSLLTLPWREVPSAYGFWALVLVLAGGAASSTSLTALRSRLRNRARDAVEIVDSHVRHVQKVIGGQKERLKKTYELRVDEMNLERIEKSLRAEGQSHLIARYHYDRVGEHLDRARELEQHLGGPTNVEAESLPHQFDRSLDVAANEIYWFPPDGTEPSVRAQIGGDADRSFHDPRLPGLKEIALRPDPAYTNEISRA